MRQNKGSIMVETAMVLPVFLFLFMNIVSLFEMIYIHSVLDSALICVGKEISAYARFSELYEKDVLTEIYVRERVVQAAGREILDESVIIGGSKGIVLYRSEVREENDVIDLVMTYRVEPLFPFFGVGKMTLMNRCYIKAYTGYEREEQDNGSTRYYVAEYGEVYHLSRSCTHLQLTISMLNISELERARNEDGCRYLPCEVCYDRENSVNRVYITTQGDRYHSSIACVGLKRTIYVIPASAIGNKTMCLRCGGGG